MHIKTDKIKEGWKARVEKALTTSDFLNGGRLSPVQQNKFQDFIRGVSDITKYADIQFVSTLRGTVDREHMGRSVLSAASEYTTFTAIKEPEYSAGSYTLRKLAGGFDVGFETMVENIEKQNYKSHLINMFMDKASFDIADVAVNGDTLSADPLYSTMDGFYKLSDNSILYSNGSAEISRRSFLAGFRALPKEVRRKKSQLRWFMNSVLYQDWEEVLGDRATNLGDSAVQGRVAAPSGIPILIADEIADNVLVGYTSAKYGKHTGTVADPFTLVAATNDAITINVTIDGAASGNLALVATAGTYTAPQLANHLNVLAIAAGTSAVFYTDGEGHLVVRTTKTGATQSVEIVAVANDIYTTTGLTAAAYSGAAASASGTIYNGTYAWLTMPMNFRIYVLDNIRSNWDYQSRKDGWEFTMYYYMEPYIVDETAMVRVDDIRMKDYY